jgi:RNA polymerase sigma-70 factor (TIGR02960 family)
LPGRPAPGDDGVVSTVTTSSVTTTGQAGPAAEDLEALRGRLTGYCYRMLGSAADADDAVQETFLRACQALDRYDAARGRLSTWVHQIATNVCLDLLRGARRRAMAIDLGPARTSLAPGDFGTPLPADRFIEPIPDARVIYATDPAEIATQRQTVRLAFISALQRLAPRQRAVLVLREVLCFSAGETAEVLQTSVPAVNSALQRARARLDATRAQATDVFAPDDPAQRRLLEDYVAAFEAHDIAGLQRLLHADARASMPPFAWWLDGRDTILALMASSDACVGDRLVPVPINGSPGFRQYRLDGAGELRPFALSLAELRGGRVAHTVTFLGSAGRFAEFGLPAQLEPAAAAPR